MYMFLARSIDLTLKLGSLAGRCINFRLVEWLSIVCLTTLQELASNLTIMLRRLPRNLVMTSGSSLEVTSAGMLTPSRCPCECLTCNLLVRCRTCRTLLIRLVILVNSLLVLGAVTRWFPPCRNRVKFRVLLSRASRWSIVDRDRFTWAVVLTAELADTTVPKVLSRPRPI